MTDLLSAEAVIEIPFHDCDPMQVVWHGNYARYLEVARCELLRKIDYDYLQMSESGYMWPIVDMRIKYVGSALFMQKIHVKATLKEYESRIKIDYLITDADSGAKLTKATTVQVAVDLASKEMLFESPQVLLDKLAKVINL
ncbi:MAG: acyl-CoA thioesterase [Cognaticolwellia aestuarii]